jgi:type IV pilus assembly protein PilN
MAKINLLPWREELRRQRQIEFLTVLGMVVAAAAVAGFLWNFVAQGDVEEQRKRNAFITQEIAQLEESIAEIDELQRRRDSLVERMTVIQGLQGNRPVIVHVFEELVTTLPDGAYYTTVKATGSKLDITGVAESNNRISNLMRSLEQSTWFKNPQLNKVTAEGEVFVFSLTLDLELPAQEAGSAGSESNDASAKKNTKKKGK